MPALPTMCPSAPDEWRDRRVLIVVAHPDDEVLGCGALLATLRDVRIVHVTNGAPCKADDWQRLGFERAVDYAAARRGEALAALAVAGLPADRLVCLGVADQEASTQLVDIARQLAPLVAQADVVLTHAYEGGHPDHDAVAFAVNAAQRLHGGSAELFEMPFYYGAETGWVRQHFVSAPTATDTAITRVLSPSERTLKTRMIAAHATQRETLACFALDAERFRLAPDHDFTRRPHAGPILYESHGWNLTWETWTDRVEAARSALALAAPRGC